MYFYTAIWQRSVAQRRVNMAAKKVLEVYLDMLSQPCRAVHIFLNHNKIPHTVKTVALRKGEHRFISVLLDSVSKISINCSITPYIGLLGVRHFLKAPEM